VACHIAKGGFAKCRVKEISLEANNQISLAISDDNNSYLKGLSFIDEAAL
jgi:hypothetical protein